MDWKEFLKPNWRKIILCIILIFWVSIGFLILFISVGSKSSNLISYLIFSILVLPSIPFYNNLFLTLLLLYFKFGIILIGGLIIFYSYLLSCTIIHIFNNIKKKMLIRRTYEQKKIIKPEKQRNIPFKINLDRNQKFELASIGIVIGGILWEITSDRIGLLTGAIFIFLWILFMIFLILLSPIQNWIRKRFS